MLGLIRMHLPVTREARRRWPSSWRRPVTTWCSSEMGPLTWRPAHRLYVVTHFFWSFSCIVGDSLCIDKLINKPDLSQYCDFLLITLIAGPFAPIDRLFIMTNTQHKYTTVINEANVMRSVVYILHERYLVFVSGLFYRLWWKCGTWSSQGKSCLVCHRLSTTDCSFTRA